MAESPQPFMRHFDPVTLRLFVAVCEERNIATAAQREAMFVTEALAGDASLLTHGAKARLAKLAQLCPGDFAAVKRQVEILAAEFSAQEFMDQLEAEHRIKPEVRETRSMGFVQ